ALLEDHAPGVLGQDAPRDGVLIQSSFLSGKANGRYEQEQRKKELRFHNTSTEDKRILPRRNPLLATTKVSVSPQWTPSYSAAASPRTGACLAPAGSSRRSRRSGRRATAPVWGRGRRRFRRCSPRAWSPSAGCR